MKRLLSMLLLAICVLPSAARATGPEPFDPAVIQASPSLREMETDAAAALLVDESYGKILFAYNARTRRYPASITKVMTCLLAVEALERGQLTADQPITAGDDLYAGIGSGGSTQNLKAGEVLTVEQLLYCAMLPSANEACNVLAQAVSGSIPAFVDQMNQRAAQLGMADTHFANTHGYHDEAHYTTAYDIYLLVQEALAHPLLRQVMSATEYTLPATNLSDARTMHNSNALLDPENSLYYCPDAIGVKTGSTPEAGYCLASAAQRGSRVLICVVLGAQRIKDADGVVVDAGQFRESRRLLEWGLDHFDMAVLTGPEETLGHAAVAYSQQGTQVELLPSGSLSAFLPDDIDPAALTYTLEYPDTLEAPVTQGQVVGTVTVRLGDTVYGTLELTAGQSLDRSLPLWLAGQAAALYGLTWVKLALLIVVAGLLVLVFRLCFIRPKKGRRIKTRR